MRKAILIGLLSATVALQACDGRRGRNYNDKSMVSGRELTFMKEASEAGLVELEASSLAKSRSANQRIKQYASMLFDQHAKMGNDLKNLQSDNNLTPSDTISIDKQKEIAGLANLQGADFDKVYIAMMLSGHEKAVKSYTDAKNYEIKSVKKLAKKYLPELQAHLDSAKAISASLK